MNWETVEVWRRQDDRCGLGGGTEQHATRSLATDSLLGRRHAHGFRRLLVVDGQGGTGPGRGEHRAAVDLGRLRQLPPAGVRALPAGGNSAPLYVPPDEDLARMRAHVQGGWAA